MALMRITAGTGTSYEIFDKDTAHVIAEECTKTVEKTAISFAELVTPAPLPPPLDVIRIWPFTEILRFLCTTSACGNGLSTATHVVTPPQSDLLLLLLIVNH